MSLGTRLFLIIALLVTLTISGAIGATYYLSRDVVDAEVESALTGSQSVQRVFSERELRELELISALIASDSAFVAYVSQALRADSPEGVASVADLLQERGNEFGFDFSMVLDTEGQVLVQTGNVVNPGRDLSQHPVIADVIARLRVSSGLWFEDEAVLQMAVVPLVRGRTVEGLVVTGAALGSETVADLSRVSRTEVAYMNLGQQRPTLSISTLAINDAQALGNALRERTDWIDGLRQGESIARQDIPLGETVWTARISPVENSTGVLISLIPQERLLRGVNSVVNALILAGVLSIVLALFVSVLLARRMLQPVTDLASAAEAAAKGEFPRKIELDGSGEIGRLRQAFNRLIIELREQSAVERYLADLWQQRSDESEAHSSDPTEAISRDGSEDQAGPRRELTFPPGKRLGKRYEIIRAVGRGGMGVVYEALDRELNEVVALKTLRAELLDNPEHVARMKQEIKLTRRITHPNVVRIFDLGNILNVPLISMEYVRGITLEQALKRSGRVDVFVGMRLAREICRGVAAAHNAGVIHRDIKPANVIISHHAKVMDFGIADPSLGAVDATTHKRELAGTASYLAPEQIRGEHADERSDIYALGVLMCQMFTGNLPIKGRGTEQILRAHLEKAPTPPRSYLPEISISLNNLILQCLEKDPADRPATVDLVLERLEEIRIEG
jgi:tRNA A-37 threonylcarbamoyl transferase component Bud32/HAMP domain-containing protein